MTNGTSLFFSAHHDCRHKFKNWNIRHDIFDHVVCCHIPPRWFNLSTIKPIKEGNFLSLIRDGGRSENLGWQVVISAPALLPPYSDLPIFGERASAIPAFVHAYLSTDFLFSEFLLINVKLVRRTCLFQNPSIILTRTTRWFWNFSEFFEKFHVLLWPKIWPEKLMST